MNETPLDAQKAETTGEHTRASGFYMEVVDDDMAAVLRQKSAFERLQIANRMWIGARSVMRASILSQNPTWTADEVNRAILRRVLGRDYPDDAIGMILPDVWGTPCPPSPCQYHQLSGLRVNIGITSLRAEYPISLSSPGCFGSNIRISLGLQC